MVRYSTGCRNCVKRRVRCDERSPICRNCQRIGLVCGGPRSGTIFIRENQAQSHHHVHDKHDQESGTIPAEDSSLSKSSCTTIVLFQHSSQVSCKSDETIFFLRKFWQAEDRPWIEACILQPERYPTATAAVESLAAAFYGRKRRDLDIISDAQLKYGKALLALQHQLSQPNLEHKVTFDILAAGTALGRYEKLICSTFQAWLQHAGGMSKAMEMLGPDSFRDYPNRYILEANVYRITQEAYHRRRRTFLQQEEWRQLQLNIGRLDTATLELQDLYMRLAGVAEDVTYFLADTAGRQCQIPLILSDIELMLSDLRVWFSSKSAPKREVVHKRCCSSKKYHSIYVDGEGVCFDTVLRYPNLEAASQMNMWRSIKITVLEWRYKLLHPWWWAGDHHEGMADIPELHDLAIDICRSMHHHFYLQSNEVSAEGNLKQSKPTLRAGGARDMFPLLLSANCAFKVLDRRSPEAKWIEKLLDHVADLTGVELSRNLLKAFTIKWRTDAILAQATAMTST